MNFMSGKPGFNSHDHQITATRPGMSSSSLHELTYHHRHQDCQGSSPSHEQMFGSRGVLEEGCSAAASNVVIEREHMFDKVVTPSDVGKLNRLVIPKQHAEKYFPLDSSTNEKGLLLSFEDRNGKPWRFRYSYWNSSQSYVMTKGWSRFVKDKKLDAGDIVSFQRGVGELGKDRLFIDWRRRPDHAAEFPTHQFSFHRSIHPWNPLFLHPPPSREYSHFLKANPLHHHYPAGQNPYAAAAAYNTSSVVNGNPCPPGSIVYLQISAPAASAGEGGVGFFAPQQMGMTTQTEQRVAADGNAVEQMVFESVPVVQGKAAAKRLRLFGVNMDCPISESDECNTTLSHSPTPLQLLPHHPSSTFRYPSYHPSIPPLHDHNHNYDKGKGSMSFNLDM